MFVTHNSLRVKRNMVRKANKFALISRGAVIDQFDSMHFNINDAGFVRNDISQLARAQSYSEFQLILSRLEKTDSSFLPNNFDRADVIRNMRPRYCQSEVEISQYLDYVAEGAADKLDSAYRVSLEKEVDKQNTDENQTVNPE